MFSAFVLGIISLVLGQSFEMQTFYWLYICQVGMELLITMSGWVLVYYLF